MDGEVLERVYKENLEERIIAYLSETKMKSVGKLEISRFEGLRRDIRDMIKILFVCHGSILKSPEKASRINDFTARHGTYYTTTTPFFERALK